MDKKTKAQLWEKIGEEYIKGGDEITYESQAQKYGYSIQTVSRYAAPSAGNWSARRITFRVHKRTEIIDQQEEKNTRIEDLFDRQKFEIKSLELLDWFMDQTKNKQAKAKILEKMTFKDFKELITLAGKIREGVGYADKVVVVKAPNMEQIRDTYAYKLGYNEAIQENQKHLPKKVVDANYSVIIDDLPLIK